MARTVRSRRPVTPAQLRALQIENERRRRAKEERTLRVQEFRRKTIEFPFAVTSYGGDFFFEEFERGKLNRNTISNMGVLANIYKNYVNGEVDLALHQLKEFKKHHRPYLTVNGKRYYWILDEPTIEEMARTRALYDIIFYGEHNHELAQAG